MEQGEENGSYVHILVRLLPVLAFPAGSKVHYKKPFSVLHCSSMLFILFSGLALISGESYITAIWKLFPHRKNVSHVLVGKALSCGSAWPPSRPDSLAGFITSRGREAERRRN